MGLADKKFGNSCPQEHLGSKQGGRIRCVLPKGGLDSNAIFTFLKEPFCLA